MAEQFANRLELAGELEISQTIYRQVYADKCDGIPVPAFKVP